MVGILRGEDAAGKSGNVQDCVAAGREAPPALEFNAEASGRSREDASVERSTSGVSGWPGRHDELRAVFCSWRR
jgi:hypothetical protein